MQTFVYFISAGSSPIKIGLSDDPQERLSTLQTAHYKRLYLLYTITCESRESAFQLEAAFHRWYDDVRLLNEWFNVKPIQIGEDINLLMSLGKSVIDFTQHVGVDALIALEEKRIAYTKRMDSRTIISEFFQQYPNEMNTKLDELVERIEQQSGVKVGRTSVHNVRSELLKQANGDEKL